MAHALSILFSVCLLVVIFNTSLPFCLVGSLLFKILVYCVLCCGFFLVCLRSVSRVSFAIVQIDRLFFNVTYAEFDLTVPNLIYLPAIG